MYSIQQSANYLGREQWKWAVWINAEEDALDRVTQVVWQLHHTFPKPVIAVTERSTKFRLEQVGWGTFELRAEVHVSDGATVQLSHELELFYPDAEAAVRKESAAERFPRVFLSYSAEDLKIASSVKSQLVDAGIQVSEPKDVSPDLPIAVGLQKQIKAADALLTIVTSDLPSRWLATEIATAEKAHIPIFNLIESSVVADVLPESGTTLRFSATDNEALAPAIGAFLRDMKKTVA